MIPNALHCLINLPDRTDRLNQAKEEINSFFGGFYFQIVNGVKAESSSKGIAKAHLNCIKLAKDNNFDNCLILEDDVFFRKGAKEYALEAFKHYPKDFDILLGGLYSTDKLTIVNEYWKQTDTFCGLQFYIVNKKAYDTILNFNFNGHIDRFLAGRAKLKCYVTDKFFAMQHPGHSDNVRMYKDYTDHINTQIKNTKGFELL